MKNLRINLCLCVFALIGWQTLAAQTCDPAACTSKKSTKTSATSMAAPAAKLVSNEQTIKTATFTFPAGKVIEIALFSIKPGKEMVVGGEYFPKVFPVAQEYGLSSSQTFSVIKNTYGDAPVQQLGFFVWDSYEQKEAFDRDPRYLKLRNIRNGAFDYLYMGYFQVEKDVTYTFDTESVYDFAAMWVDPMNADKLPKYFEKVAPVAMGMEYGYQPIATLNPLDACTKGKYTPSFVGFAKWSVPDGFEQLQMNKTYQKYVHLRDEATPYKDVLMVKANIQ